MKFTPLYDTNNGGHRYKIHQGGTSSSKTITNLQWITNYAVRHPNTTVSVVAESLPHLKRGALRDFNKLIKAGDYKMRYQENKSEHLYTLVNNSTIEFFSADSDEKLRGGRRNILFVNECNNISYESFLELDVRTNKYTILDFNPVRPFWVHEQLLPELDAEDAGRRTEHPDSRSVYVFRKSTYRDCVDANGVSLLEQSIIDGIERRKANVNWYKVYGLGEEGLLEGLVFSNWDIVDAIDGDLLGYGVDFGYVNSPTVIIEVRELRGEIYLKEHLYKTGMQNEAIWEAVQRSGIDLRARAVADNADPKTIDWLYAKGWKGLKPSIKGADSVNFGLNLMLDKRIHVTKASVNTITEFRNYMWDTDKNGKATNVPVKDFDHSIDAARYLIAYPKKKKLVMV
jgi:phage terminase large subunit